LAGSGERARRKSFEGARLPAAPICPEIAGFSRRGKCFRGNNLPQRLKPGVMFLPGRRGWKPRPFKTGEVSFSAACGRPFHLFPSSH